MDMSWGLFPGVCGTENNMAVGFILITVGQGDVDAFDSQYTSIEEKMPGYWNSLGGRLVLQRCASRAIEVGDVTTAMHLCGTVNVPANPIPLSSAQLASICGSPASATKFNIMPTPLFTAIKMQNEVMALYLLSLPQDHNLDLDYLESPGSPLHHACRIGLLHVVEAIILHHGIDLSQETPKCPCTPLLMAGQMGHLATVDLLLGMYKARGSVDHALERSGMSGNRGIAIPLLYACTAEREEENPGYYVDLARLLVEKWGLPVPLPTDEYHKFNTFGLAVRNANVPLLDYYLTARGGPIDTADPESGRTVLHVVSFNEESNDADSLKCVRFLVETKGANPCALTNDGNVPGKYALHRKKMKTYEYLGRRAKQAKTSVEPSPETVRQAEARARMAEESLLNRVRGGRNGGPAGQAR